MLAGREIEGLCFLHIGLKIRVNMQTHTVGSDISGDITNPMLVLCYAFKLHGHFIKNFSVQFLKHYIYH